MPKFKYETQVQIVITTMTIHNFIRRNAKIDTDFDLYEDENTNINHDNYHRSANSDQSQVLNITSSSEMDRVRDSIRNQILEYKQIY
jgi:hypothetical protein